MSTLTSLISAGGGGGGSQTHIVTDPLKLHRTAIGRALDPDGNESRTPNFFTNPPAATNMGATASTSASDTYVTLLEFHNNNS